MGVVVEKAENTFEKREKLIPVSLAEELAKESTHSGAESVAEEGPPPISKMGISPAIQEDANLYFEDGEGNQLYFEDSQGNLLYPFRSGDNKSVDNGDLAQKSGAYTIGEDGVTPRLVQEQNLLRKHHIQSAKETPHQNGSHT